MVTLDQIPLNSDGLVRGSYFVVHKHESFSDGLSGVLFVKGRSQEPLGGAQLRRMVVAMGADLARIEPADAEARAAMGIPEPKKKKKRRPQIPQQAAPVVTRPVVDVPASVDGGAVPSGPSASAAEAATTSAPPVIVASSDDGVTLVDKPARKRPAAA